MIILILTNIISILIAGSLTYIITKDQAIQDKGTNQATIELIKMAMTGQGMKETDKDSVESGGNKLHLMVQGQSEG